MNDSTKIMRLEIDGQWTADDMINSIKAVQDLYNLRLILQFEYEEWLEWREFYHELKFFPPFRKRMQARLFFERENFPSCKTIIPLSEDELSRVSELCYPNEVLNIRRIKYGSKGIKDLAGIGEIIGHVKDFILELIHIRKDKEKRSLENEERKLKNQHLQLENAQKYVELAKSIGLKKSEIRQLVRLADNKQDKLVDLIDEGKIYGVRLLNSNEENLDV